MSWFGINDVKEKKKKTTVGSGGDGDDDGNKDNLEEESPTPTHSSSSEDESNSGGEPKPSTSKDQPKYKKSAPPYKNTSKKKEQKSKNKKKKIFPSKKINDDLPGDDDEDSSDSSSSSSSSSDSSEETESDVDSIDEVAAAGAGGGPNNNYLLQKLREYGRLLRKLERREKGKVFGEQPKNIPIPKFPRNVRYRKVDKSSDMKLIDFYFPKSKFSGKIDHKKLFTTMDIDEFLTLMVNAQKKCPLSREDFTGVLLNRLSSPALGMCNGWLTERGMTIERICARLYKTFTLAISEAEARELIDHYQVPINFSVDKVLSEFQYLGSYLMRSGHKKKVNSIVVALIVQEALDRCMPPEAATLIFEQTCDLRRYYGRQPYLGEIITGLSAISDKINKAMRRAKNWTWAKSRDFLAFTTKQHVKEKQGGKGGNKKGSFPKANEVSVNEANTQQAKPNKQQNAKGNQKNAGKMPQNAKGSQSTKPGQNSTNPKKNSNKNGKPKEECSYCGSYTHNCYKGCYSVLDDNNKMYCGPPAQEDCSICLKAFKGKKKLRHPVLYCPLREKMKEKYRTGELTPRGCFKSAFEEEEYGTEK